MLDLTNLGDALRHEGGLSRRLFLAYGAALGSIPLLGREFPATAGVRFSDDPFSLGVASGDPDADGMVLWTRLAPRPLEGDGGMPSHPASVAWEVSEDEVIKNGRSLRKPLGHASTRFCLMALLLGISVDVLWWNWPIVGSGKGPNS